MLLLKSLLGALGAATVFTGAMLGIAAPAYAKPVTWTLNSVTLTKQAVTGSFVYDADKGIYSSVNVSYGGQTYVAAHNGGYNQVVFVTGTANLPGSPVFLLQFGNSLTDQMGTDRVTGAIAGTCDSTPQCGIYNGNTPAFTGSITGSAATTTTVNLPPYVHCFGQDPNGSPHACVNLSPCPTSVRDCFPVQMSGPSSGPPGTVLTFTLLGWRYQDHHVVAYVDPTVFNVAPNWDNAVNVPTRLISGQWGAPGDQAQVVVPQGLCTSAKARGVSTLTVRVDLLPGHPTQGIFNLTC